MQLTFFSFFEALLWSVSLVLLQHIFIKKRAFIRRFGISSILFLYLFPLFRAMFPVEFSFTRVLTNRFLWNRLYDYLCIDKIIIFDKSYHRISLLLSIYLIGVFVTIVLFCARYKRAVMEIGRLGNLHSSYEQEVLESVVQSIHKEIKIKVLVSPIVESPMAMGILEKKIILPVRKYSEDELFYILLHEVTHFVNHDIVLKILVQIFCCIFWWNPIVYLLQKDLEQVLEIKCDLRVVESMDKVKKIDYLSTIVRVVEGQKNNLKKHGFESVSIVGSNQKESLVERFEIVSDSNRNKNSLVAKLIWNTGLACTVLASYLFVIQPSYDAPQEEIVTEENVYEMKPENTVIVKQSDGTYLLIHESGYQELIEKETAETLMLSGFKIKKE